MSDANCPRCGAEKYVNAIPQTDMAGNPFPNASEFSCGSTLQTYSDFCREREAHNQTKRERDDAREAIRQFYKAKGRFNSQIACAKMFEIVGLPFEYPKKEGGK